MAELSSGSESPFWAPPEPPPAARRTTNGFAVAAFIFGILGGLLGLLFGIIALVQLRRPGQKGRGWAVTGLCLGVAWVVLIAVVLIDPPFAAKRDNNGQISARGSIALTDLKVGDCFDGIDGIEEDENTTHVTAVPCGQPHDAQVLAIETLPGGGYPGDQRVTQLAGQRCDAGVGKRLAQSRFAAKADLYYFQPTSTSWRLGDHTVQCVARGTLDKIDSFIVLPPLDPTKKEWDELRPGDCIKETSEELSLVVTIVSCSKPHAAQLVSRFTLPDGPWPGESTVDARGSAGCGDRLDSYFAEHPAPMAVDGITLTPNAETWSQGDRLVLCAVTAPKGKLTRSVMAR